MKNINLILFTLLKSLKSSEMITRNKISHQQQGGVFKIQNPSKIHSFEGNLRSASYTNIVRSDSKTNFQHLKMHQQINPSNNTISRHWSINSPINANNIINNGQISSENQKITQNRQTFNSNSIIEQIYKTDSFQFPKSDQKISGLSISHFHQNQYLQKIQPAKQLIQKLVQQVQTNQPIIHELTNINNKIGLFYSLNELQQAKQHLNKSLHIFSQFNNNIIKLVNHFLSETQNYQEQNKYNYEELKNQYNNYQLNRQRYIQSIISKLNEQKVGYQLLRKQNEQLKKNIQELTKENSQKFDFMKSLQKIQIQKQSLVKSLEFQKHQLVQFKRKASQYNNLQEKNKQLLDKLKQKMQELNYSKRQIHKLQKDNKSISNQLTSKQAEIKVLTKQINLLKAKDEQIKQQRNNIPQNKQIIKIIPIRDSFQEIIRSPKIYKKLPTLNQSREQAEEENQKNDLNIIEPLQNNQHISQSITQEIKSQNINQKLSIKLIPIQYNQTMKNENEKIIQQKQNVINNLNQKIEQLTSRNYEYKICFEQLRVNKIEQQKIKDKTINEFRQKINQLSKQIIQLQKKQQKLMNQRNSEGIKKNDKSQKIFEDSIIYNLKTQNQFLRRKLFEKINNIDIKTYLQINKVPDNIQFNNNKFHIRNKTSDLKQTQISRLDLNQEEDSLLKFYQEKNQQLENRVNQMLKINKELKYKIQSGRVDSSAESTISFYKQQLEKSEKLIQNYQNIIKQLTNQKNQTKVELENQIKIMFYQLNQTKNQIHYLQEKLTLKGENQYKIINRDYQ